MKSLPLLVICIICLCHAVSAQRKNVLLLLGEGTGLWLGAYNNTQARTPSLDQLASRGVTFTRAYASDCSSSPARAALLSGLPQHQTGLYGRSDGASHFSSYPSLHTLPSILRSNNIRTGLIGRKHVKPDSVFQFDFEATEEQYDLKTIGRNISFIRDLVSNFLTNDTTRPFFLTVSFNDAARCRDGDRDQYGEFCQVWGSGTPGKGSIPGWKPVTYDPHTLTLPYYLPYTPQARQDLADMYTALNRLDQGVGMVMAELQKAGVADDTLVLYTAIGGPSFPQASDNLYEPGMAVPLLLSSPLHRDRWAQRTEALASTVDVLPTVLDWFNVPYPSSPSPTPKLTGKSLLPLTVNPANVTAYDRAFSSHSFDEVTMYYPMRVIRTPRYRLLHNLDYHSPFPVSEPIATSPTFFTIVNSTRYSLPTFWFKPLTDYCFRPQWELYDTDYDRFELENDALDPAHSSVAESLKRELKAWQELTQDPWRCLPAGVMLGDGSCLSVGNREP